MSSGDSAAEIPPPKREHRKGNTAVSSPGISTEMAGAASEKTGETAVENIRMPASVLLLYGLALALLSILTIRHTEGFEKAAVTLLAAAGVAAFLVGGRTVVESALPEKLQQAVNKPARTFDLSTGQVFLLIFAFLFALLARFAAGDMLLARLAPVSTIAWAVALACAVFGALGDESLADIPLAWSDIYFTTFLFGAALLMRGLASDLIPTTFSGDEGSVGLLALQFVDGRADNLFTVGWFDFPSLYFAIQGAGIAFFGRSVPALRLVSALGGALTVVGLYWLARVTFDVAMARIASLILLASHYHMHMSRIALNNIWDGLFAVLTVAGLWYGWKTGRRLGFVLAGLCLGLGQYFYITMRAMPLVVAVWLAGAFLVKREQFRLRLPGLLLAAYIALIAILPLGLYFSRHTDQLYARSNHVSIFGEWMESQTAMSGRSEIQVFAGQMANAALGLVSEPLRLLYEPNAPLLLAVAATLFVIGLLWAFYDFDLRYWLLLLPVLATLIMVALSRDAPSSQRYIMVVPFVVLFVALPIGLLTEWLRRLWPHHKRLASVPAAVLIAWIMVSETGYYFNSVYERYLLGGNNTLVATEVAAYLQDGRKPRQVVFYGYPRMGFHSHSTVSYLAPDVQGWDVPADAIFPPDWALNDRTSFIFLPERLADLSTVLATYPDGEYEEIPGPDGQTLFSVYTAE